MPEQFRTISFFLWDGGVVTFSEESGPFAIEVDNGIVFITQGDEETGIPTSSVKFSVEQQPNGGE